MAIVLQRYEFMPDDGSEIQICTIMSLSLDGEKLGMTDREVQRVVNHEIGTRAIRIKEVGDFRRIK